MKRATALVQRPTEDSVLKHLSTDDLRSHLARAIEMTAEAISYMASVVDELERRGEDLSAMRSGLLPYLRAVAARRLAPEAVVAFAGQRMFLRSLERLPLEEQREIASGKKVAARRGGEIVEVDPRGAPAREIASPEGRRPATLYLRDAAEYSALLQRARGRGMTISNFLRDAVGLEPIVPGRRGRPKQ